MSTGEIIAVRLASSAVLFTNVAAVVQPSSHLFNAKVYVTLRPSVLDPAGTAVRSGLSHMGYDNVSKVRIGKYIELELSADSEASALAQLDKICDQLLANPVIENYPIEVFEAVAA